MAPFFYIEIFVYFSRDTFCHPCNPQPPIFQFCEKSHRSILQLLELACSLELGSSYKMFLQTLRPQGRVRGVTALKRAVSGEKQIYSGNLEILPGIRKPGKFFGKYEIFSGN